MLDDVFGRDSSEKGECVRVFVRAPFGYIIDALKAAANQQGIPISVDEQHYLRERIQKADELLLSFIIRLKNEGA
ncbi:MAG: hypothetical protein AB1486_22250 [Planctomycetota bacterium]